MPQTGTDLLGLDFQWHHRLPQQFEAFFASIQIDIHSAEFGILLEDTDHTNLHNLKECCCEKTGNYNALWDAQINNLKQELKVGLSQKAAQGAVRDMLENLQSIPRYKSLLANGLPIPGNLDRKSVV